MTVASLTADAFIKASPAPEVERRRLAGRKRRALVLTNESARHPFRASLPPHVTKVQPASEKPAQLSASSFWQLTKDDIRGFASVYFAAFAAVLVFIL